MHVPKGQSEHDVGAVATRTVAPLLPFSLKSTDSNVTARVAAVMAVGAVAAVAAVATCSMNATLLCESHAAHHQFVGGRRFCANLAEMDLHTRLLRTALPDSDCPVLAFVDRLAALARVSRTFLCWPWCFSACPAV